MVHRFQIDRGIFANGGVWAAARFDADDPLGREGFIAHQKIGVFTGVDIVGDHGQVVTVAQGQAQGQGQGRFAGTDRATDADAQGLAVHNVLH